MSHYPILLLLVVTRRRDWAIPLACFVTIALAYIPFIVLGHGHVFGFFSTYATEQRQNAGVVPLVIHWITYTHLHVRDSITVVVQYIVDVLLIGPLLVVVLILRLRERISMDVATLILIGAVYNLSTHIFPWYIPALLLFVPLLLTPLWTSKGLQGRGIIIVAVWYFVCIAPIGYFFRNATDWSLYYTFDYGIPVFLFAVGFGCIIHNYRSVKVHRVQ